MFNMKRYKVKEVTDILGINKSRIQYYKDTGVIVPLEDSKGPGTNRYFSTRNIAEILLAMTLTQLGVGIRTNAKIIQGLLEVENQTTKDLIKDGELKKGERLSVIEPGAFDMDGITYLSISFHYPDDPSPVINVHPLLNNTAKNILDIDFEGSSHVLMVNLSRIRSILEEKLG